MNIDADLLDRTLTAALAPVVGRRLTGVVYLCLDGECCVETYRAKDFSTGGALRLAFDDDAIHITWNENAGWREHFSIGAYTTDQFAVRPHVEIDASDSPIWEPHIGLPLIGTTVLGWRGTPHAIGLTFMNGTVFAAIGYENEIRNGDDVLIRSDEAFWMMLSVEGIEVMWQSRASSR